MLPNYALPIVKIDNILRI
uniref:Uncharacterized protein n=1 Tax=Anopheles arabiensis TaxID=7173 RepID=A0A182IFS2_ANOAR